MAVSLRLTGSSPLFRRLSLRGGESANQTNVGPVSQRLTAMCGARGAKSPVSSEAVRGGQRSEVRHQTSDIRHQRSEAIITQRTQGEAGSGEHETKFRLRSFELSPKTRDPRPKTKGPKADGRRTSICRLQFLHQEIQRVSFADLRQLAEDSIT